MGRRKFQPVGGGRYRFQPVSPLTGRREEFTGTLAECLAKEQINETLRAQKKLGVSPAELAARQPASGDRRTLNDLYRYWVRRASPASRRIYDQNWRFRVERSIGTRCPWELTLDVLYDWSGRLAQKYAPMTVRSTVELVLMVARSAGLLVEPWKGFRMARARPKRARTSLAGLSELVAVIHAARNADEKHWQRGERAESAVAILVAVTHGLRNAELAGLSWRDLRLESIDGAPPTITVARQAPRYWNRSGKPEPDSLPKGKEIVTLPLHPDAIEALGAHRQELERRGFYSRRGPVFPDERGEWRTNGQVLRSDYVSRIVKEAGLPYEHFTVHELRHTYCTLAAKQLVETGIGDVRLLQRHMRHADQKTTWGYLHQVTSTMAAPALPRLGVAVVPALLAPSGENGVNGASHRALPPKTTLAELAKPSKPDFRPSDVKVKKKPRLRDLARAYLDRGGNGSGEPPPEVEAIARAAYQRAYRRTLGRTRGNHDRAKISGRRAYKAVGLAWLRLTGQARGQGEPPGDEN